MNQTDFAQTGREVVILKQQFRFIISGAAAGLVCGMFGAGGGMVLIPLLVHLGGMESRIAFASSLSIMLPVCLVSLVSYGITDGIPFSESLPYLIGGTAGGLLAGILYKRIPTRLLHRAMGLFILWGGLRLIWN